MGRKAESSRLVLATPARHAATEDDGSRSGSQAGDGSPAGGSSGNGARADGAATNEAGGVVEHDLQHAVGQRAPRKTSSGNGSLAAGAPTTGKPAATATIRVAPADGRRLGDRERRGVREGPPDDLVIDLTGPEPTVVTGAVRQWRRWAVVLGVVAVAAVVLAVVNFSVGMQWRSRALAAQQRAQRAASAAALKQGVAARARSEVAAAEQREKAMARRLAVSEADVDALEARIAKLASAKAEAEDGGAAATPSIDRAHLRTLRKQLDSCITQVSALRAALAEGAAPEAAHDAARAAEVACEQAGSDAAVLTRR